MMGAGTRLWKCLCEGWLERGSLELGTDFSTRPMTRVEHEWRLAED